MLKIRKYIDDAYYFYVKNLFKIIISFKLYMLITL
jgi:hypothetical protein